MKATILLAEDNPQDVFLTRRAFRKAGVLADLQVVTNGEDALTFIRNYNAESSGTEPPRLLILDLRLPRFSGHEILEWLQQHEVSAVPAVVLSTSRESSDIDKAMQLGARRYLCKPLDPAALVGVLNDLGMADLLGTQG